MPVNITSDQQWLEAFRLKAARERIPISGMLELTSRCNLRCVHCYLGPQETQQQKRSEEMSTEDVFRVLDEIIEAGCLMLTITGGDDAASKRLLEELGMPFRRD